MKYFSFKLLILCFIVPPILFLFSLQGMERYMTGRYAGEVEDIYTGDTTKLLTGATPLSEALHDNIDRYLAGKGITAMGVKIDVTVRTKNNMLLYPSVLNADPLESPGPRQVAARNFKLLSEGLDASVKVGIAWTGILAVATFSVYLMFSLWILFEHYRKGVRRASAEEREKSLTIDRLVEQQKRNANRLKALERERNRISSDFETTQQKLKDLENLKREYRAELNALGKEKKKVAKELKSLSSEYEKAQESASSNEEGMLEEIMALEEKIRQADLARIEEKERDEELMERIRRFEREKEREEKQKTREASLFRKRFKTFYKNIRVNDKAINGYIDLTEEMRLKGEEVIHRLNAEPEKVTVKRKMAVKKGRRTVLEVPFAYDGRLYFARAKDNMIEVLTMGTKHTQNKDLAFLNSLAPE